MLRNSATRCRSSFGSSYYFKLAAFNSTSPAVVRYLTSRVDHDVAQVLHGAPSSRRKPMHRLFLAGTNPFLPPHLQSSVSPTFTEVPLDEWISSLSGGGSRKHAGSSDTTRKKDLEITHLTSGFGHAMIAFRDRRTNEEKIFAIGRNESGQLGVGYNSQEPTRGLVEGFQGDHIEDVKCGITSSYIQVRQGDRSVIYVSGNQHRGQLGIPPPEKGQTPSQAFLSTATLLDLPGQSVKEIACGYEHLLILTEQGLLLGTGINTDGQLGTGDDVDRHIPSPVKIPAQILQSGIMGLSAGADTSSVITSDGTVFTFGNSEYAQAFHGEKIDRILEPKMVDTTTMGKLRVQSFKTAGSSSLLLDDEGYVYSAGFGAIGQGEEQLSCIEPMRVDGLERISHIYAGYSCAAAVDVNQDLCIMGLNTSNGRLGVASSSNVYRPRKLPRLLPEHEPEGFEIANVAMSRETCMIHVIDHSEP